MKSIFGANDIKKFNDLRARSRGPDRRVDIAELKGPGHNSGLIRHRKTGY